MNFSEIVLTTWAFIGSKDRLDRAKTIDLCQNPLTVSDVLSPPAYKTEPGVQKEPKLDRAKQIPEWEVYDAEISAFAKRLMASETDAERPKPHDEL